MGGNLGKNLVIAGALLAAGFFAAWLRFRPYLGTEGSFTDGVETFDAARLERVRYAIWESPEPLPGEANSAENERKPAVTPDGRHLVFAVGELGLGTDLWIADLVDGSAVEPRPLSAVNTPSDDLAPAFAGDKLWFASNRPGSSGGLDLWTASYDRGAFGPPERVLGNLNSPGDDTDPAPVPGTDVIVFASNRGKLGAYPDFDLFAARLARPDADPDAAPEASLGVAAPLVYEVAPLPLLNSRFEEREPTFTADGRAVVFASDREGGAGGFDLYRSGLLPGATIDGLGQGLVPPEPLIGVNGATDERGPFLSLDGFTLYFGIEAEIAGRPAADLFRASSKELFRTPGRPVGWRELLLLGLLLLLALLAALAKRWRALDVLYKCVLVSLLVHLLLLWWAREVYPEPAAPAALEDGDRMRVRLVVDPESLSAQRNREREGEVQVARAAREEAESPERAESRVVEVERELAAAALSIERAASAPDASTPARREVGDAAPTPTRLRAEAVASAAEAFERLAEAGPAPVDVRASEVRAERSERVVDRPRTAAPVASEQSESATALAPLATARLERSSRSAATDLAAPAPVRSAVPVDRASGAPAREVAVAAPVERRLPSNEGPDGAAAGSAAAAAGSASSELELVAADTSLARTRGPVERSSGPSAPNPPNASSSPNASSGPARAALSGPAASTAAGPALAPSTYEPLARSARGGDPSATSAPAFVAATLAAPTRATGAGTQPLGIELVAPRAPERTSGSPGSAELANATGVLGPAESAPGFDPLAELAPSGATLARSARGPAESEDRGPGRPGVLASAAPDGDRRTPSPSTLTFEVGARLAGDPTPPTPQRSEWDHTPYQSRSGAQKAEALTVFGGSAETELAVTRGLVYLASVQRPEGQWGRIERDDKYGYPAVGKTGLALLAFLGAGHTQKSNTEHSAVVARAIQFLLGVQDGASGHFGDSDAYSHGIATYALAECYALTKDERLVEPLRDAVQHIVDAQLSSGEVTADGGWGYYYPTNRVYDRWPRASVTAWQVMALESAQLGGLEVPKQVFRRAASFLASSWDPERGAFRYSQDPQRLRSSYPTLPGSTPASIFALSLLGADVSSADFRAARRFVTDRMPNGYRFTSEDDFVHKAQGNLYFWYYGTLALFRVGGDEWKRWNVAMKETLLPSQDQDGSWRPISVYAEYAQDTDRDRAYTTALCVLTLEVYYRYFTPLLKVD